MRQIAFAALLAFLPGCALFQADPKPAVEAIDALDMLAAEQLRAELQLVDRIEDPAAQATFRAFFLANHAKAADLRGDVLDYLLAIGDVDVLGLYKRFRERQQAEGVAK